MADTAERVILEAEDTTAPAVNSANAGLESFEKKAVSAHTNVVRITDQTRTSVQRLITSLEKQADTYGKSGVEKLIVQRDQLLQRYAKEPTAIDAVTKSYEKMMAVEEKAARENAIAKHAKETEEALKKQTESINSFGERIKQGIENPIQGGTGAISSMTTALGPWGTALSAGAAVLTTLAAAGWEAAKSLGELGLGIRDVELRTGLSSKEVAQFSYAAKAVGQDISIVERMMRGLSEATSDNSKEGEKAKKALKDMGVELRNSFTGELKPTAAMLLEIAEGLNKLPEGVERDAAALAIFKKAGIEAIPVIEGLLENSKHAKEIGLGLDQETVERYERYFKAIKDVELAWGSLARMVKDPLAATVIFTAKWLGFDSPQGAKDAAGRVVSATGPFGSLLAGYAQWGGRKTEPKPDSRADQLSAISTYAGKVDSHQQTVAAQEAYEDQLGLAGQLKQAEAALSKMTKPEDATSAKDVNAYSAAEKEIDGLKKQIEAGKHATSQAKEELKAFQSAAKEFEKKGDEAELDAIDKIYYARDVLLKQAAHVKASESDIALIRKAADEQAIKASDKIIEKNRAERASFEAHDNENSAARLGRASDDLYKPALKNWTEGFAADEQIENIQMQSQRGELQRRASQSFRMSQLSADALPKDATIGERSASEERVAKQAFDTRVNLALQLTAIEVDRISKEDDANKKRVMAAQAQKDLYTQLAEAQDQFAEKELEIQHKRNEEIEKQIDGLQSKSEKLFETLFTKPKDFGKELGATLHAAVLKPVIDTVSKGAANLLHPLIYGKDGDGGINGLFHPSKDPVRVSTDQNTSATMQNSAVMAALTAVMAAGMGIAAPQVQGTAGAPSISVQQVTKNMSGGNGVRTILDLTTGRGSSSAGGFVSSGGSFAPSYSGSDSDGLPMSSVRSSMPDIGGASSWTDGSAMPTFMGNGGASRGFNAGAILGPAAALFQSGQPGGQGSQGTRGGGSMIGQLSGFAKNFKNTNWGSFSRSAGTQGSNGDFGGETDNPADPSQAGNTGRITGVGGIAGAGLMMGGTALAQAGLLGTRRGTWGGVAEGTAGGAMIGLQMGGPLGAAIGAGVGFGIGVGEIVAGVKSDEQVAHDDIKTAYGVDIPVNSGTIKQIVQMAKQNFGGSISIAVRSPSVRQLVMLYSEATGQKTALSASQPYGGSLAESGGKLYQQASYLDGQAHTYASNIPTLGGLSSSNYPTPGGPNTAGGSGPTYLSVNVDGQGLAPFMQGNYLNPQFISDQSMAAQNASINRTQQSANLNLPGLSVG